MLDREVFSLHISKIKFLLNKIEKNYVAGNKPDILGNKSKNLIGYIDQTIDLFNLLKNNVKPIDWFISNYPNLLFEEINAPNYVYSVTNRNYDFSIEQAIQIRNRLLSDGLVWFCVKYESNGLIDWQPAFDEPDYLRLFNNEFSSIWSIKRSATDSNVYFFTYKISDIDETKAVEMANNIKRRFPVVTPVVFYGPKEARKRITGNYYENKITQEEESGVDIDPRDT